MLAASIAVVLVSVGAASVRTTQATHGRWVMRDLGTLGRDYSQAWEINGRGQIICNSWDGGNAPLDYPDAFPSRERAFLWENDKMSDLNGKVDADASRTLQSADSINDAGHIVGSGYTMKGQTFTLKTFLLTRRR